MMRGDCLVGTPVRPWSPAVLSCDTKTMHDSGISPGRSSSSGGPLVSPRSPGGLTGSPDSTEQFPHSPNNTVRQFSLNARSPSDSNGFNHPSIKLENGHFLRDGYLSTPISQYANFAAFADTLSGNTPPEDPLERLKLALERSKALATVFKSEESKESEQQDGPAKKEFPCPLCAYTTPYRHRYMEHVSTHYSDKCTLCDFKGENVIELRSHLSEAHGVTGGDLADLADPTDQTDQPSDGQEDEDNAKRGKPKNFKCKQCSFVTCTKVDFWEHNKTHIKAEKLLTCPKCPFVTEYKHHLEYHLRNHFGSKPFKCNKCSYSCVNKSMLNSHLKSHSNVYQYRCADCAYATKYCHSLKLHLRKYDHNPAMVLNQDGSPNPLPIIDVYGTRRGPKQKPKSQENMEKDSLPGGIVIPPAPHSRETEDLPPKLMGCQMCEFYTGSMEILNQHMYKHTADSPFAQMFRTNNNMPDQGAIKDYLQNMFLSTEAPPSPLSLVSPHHSPLAYLPTSPSPLDLSKPEPGHKDNQRPRDERKNRRKGKAYKLERPTQDNQNDEPISMVKRECSPMEVTDEAEVQEKFNERQPLLSPTVNPFEIVETKLEEPQRDFKIKIPSWKGKHESISDIEESSNSGDKSDAEGYSCHFCDMAFKDVVMYTMHMGYHGYRNPFTCNMCGQETSNRVAFFLHIARQPHS